MTTFNSKETDSRKDTSTGNAMISICAAALGFNLLMVIGIIGLLAYHGLGAFWQRELVLLTLDDGTRLLGEVHDREKIPLEVQQRSADDPENEGGPRSMVTADATRIRLKTGNRDVTGRDFIWIDERRVSQETRPEDATILERTEYGNFYGFALEIRKGENVLAAGADDVWKLFPSLHAKKLATLAEIRDLEQGAVEDVNIEIEDLRLARRGVEISSLPDEEKEERFAAIDERFREAQSTYETLAARLFALHDEVIAETLVMETADGRTREMPVSNVVRALRPNSMGLGASLGLYASRIGEFLWDNPRESNTEGGIFPAIFGTVVMVFLMTLFCMPLGVLAALYLREYTKENLFVRMVRIAVNNLAGVPSIVFGVFGLGFFVYLVGGTIDKLFYPEALPTATFGTGGLLWASLTLALLTLPVVIVATEEGLAAVPRAVREGSYALGATRLETTARVVLPAAAPGVLTGMVLAMARAAGEVAPLMIVGMVKLAPRLPLDGQFPFVHLDRKFMHLGFHIYDVGFQSPNVEAAKPLVFATALLLVILVIGMNLTAIAARNHLRRKYESKEI
ncbi:MAG: phosphate ABC transporter permease PstA [Planctomycetes bacterium]|nr:phosphate ABC transporter permease PstA [Planctomycetota bacterium]